jgi:hypothetical protein
MLAGIKLLHSVVWALLAGTIVCIPLFTVARRFRNGFILSGIVWVECAILALNHGRCPLTDVAARYTTDRAPNFDIYLPVWLAANNKLIFGSLFLISQITLLATWWISKPAASKNSNRA